MERDPPPGAGFGRMSFGQFNPQTEALQAELAARGAASERPAAAAAASAVASVAAATTASPTQPQLHVAAANGRQSAASLAAASPLRKPHQNVSVSDLDMAARLGAAGGKAGGGSGGKFVRPREEAPELMGFTSLRQQKTKKQKGSEH